MDTGKRAMSTPNCFPKAGSEYSWPFLEPDILNSLSVFNVLRDMTSPYCANRTIKIK
jgi:hypothetical protein